MKRLVMMTVIKMCGEVTLLTLLAGSGILIVGYLKKWDSSVAYSNAFFIVGCLAIIAGAASRLGAAQGSSSFQQLNVASLRNMSAGERAEFIINAGSSVRLVILGLLGGILLILISVLVARLF
jgi:hypothetical protein